MRKRLLAILLALTLIVSLMPVGAMAVEDPTTGDGGEPSTSSKVETNSNGVYIEKYVEPNDDGSYTLTLEAWSTKTVTGSSPQKLDIVLVLDVSGSMDAAMETTTTEEYVPVTRRGEEITEWNYYNLAGHEYYYKDGENYYRVVVREAGRFNRTYSLWYYDSSAQQYKQIGKTVDNWGDTIYDDILYQVYTSTSSTSKMESMQEAVKRFIDTVSTNAGENARISVVKFAGDRYSSIGDDTYDEGRNTYNYTQIVKELTTTDAAGVSALKTAVDDLEPGGATSVDYGLEKAGEVLANTADGTDKLVIVFTDGEPNHGNGFDGYVACDAIAEAQELKNNGATIYTIGVFPSDVSQFVDDYMSGVSSEYSQATGYYEEGNYWQDESFYVTGTESGGKYYFTTQTASGLEEIFEDIAESETTTFNSADENAVLSDTLSEFFNFPSGLLGEDLEGFTAQTVAMNPDGQWASDGTPVDVDVEVDGDVINVTGFDYSEHAVTETTIDGQTTYSGSKLVISFPIELDEVAVLSDNSISDGWYPTNNTTTDKAGLTNYKVGDVESSTLLNESPEVYVDKSKLDANGTDITVAVYLNGSDTPVNDPLNYVTIGRNTSDSNYRYFNQVGINGGVITYDFNYDAASGGNNCVDLDVTVGDGYFLQGVVSYQNEGSSGTDNVVPPTGTGTAYKIDNVTAVGNETDPDVKIYLYTAYSVEYYKDSDKLGDATGEEAYNDNNVYIIGESVIDTTEGDLEGEGSDWMNWQNTGYETLITVQPLPENTEGWTVGTSTTTVDPSSVTVDSVDEYADSNVIKFNSTTKQDVSYTVEYYFDDAIAEDLTETGSGEIGTQINSYEDKADQAPDGQNYVLDRVENLPLTLDEDAAQNVIEVYYALDEKGDDGPDGTPDKYQAFVDYEIVNGTWTGGETTISQVYNFYEKVEGEWVKKDPAPTLANVPTDNNAVPDAGYSTPGTWTDSTPTAGSELTIGTSYTYTYTLTGVTPTITVSVTHGTAEYGSDVKLTISSDTDEPNTGSFTVTYGSNSTITFNAQDGYVLDYVKVNEEYVAVSRDKFGTYTFSSVTENQSIEVVYAADGNGDGTPDIHQATVTYKIVNGTWSDGTKNDIPAVFNVETYNTVTGEWDDTPKTLDDDNNAIPENMNPDEDYLASSGGWYTGSEGSYESVPIDGDTAVTAGAVYTYRYTTEKNQQYEITKELTSAKRGETTYKGDSLDTYKARVGDELTYTITVENTGNVSLNNLTLTDTFTGAGTLNFDEAADGAGYSVEDNDDGTYTITITDLSSESGQNTLEITATYTVEDGDVANGSFTNTVTDNAGGEPDEDDPKVPVEMDDYTVTITPANITAYVGGNGYAGVTDGNGDIITDTETSGLPEPGYHIELSGDIVEWFASKDVTVSGPDADKAAANLADYIDFEYYDAEGKAIRHWDLEYVGVYESTEDGLNTRYVYSLSKDTIDENHYPVRLEYLDGETVIDSDSVLQMDEDTVNKTYTMRIDSGELEQDKIVAVLTVNGESIKATTDVEAGYLKVLTVADEDGDITNEIVSSSEEVTGDNVTAVAPDVIEYYVNDSEVIIQDTNRVQMLVDAVSNSPEFNSMMEQDAIDTVTAELNNPKAELFYLDLVDTENGNTKVTFRNGELTIYWPVPEDAAADSGFYVVHYTDMDRESTIGDISDAASSTLPTEVETIDGQRYVTFDVSSFSPFALVYDTEADAAGLSVNKTDNVPGNAEVERGDVVTYTVTVKNTGNVALSNIVVEDTLWGDGVDYAYIDGQSHDVSDGELTIAALAAGETVTITYSYTVTRADERAGEIVNHITATAGDGTTDGDTETTPVDDNTPIIIPDPDDDPDPVEPDFDFVPNWLNTTDHFAYIVGYEDGTIRPTNNITRAEVATIFFRLLTDDAREEFWSQTNDYTDVASDAWYNNAVSTLSNMGIIDGYEDGTFKPNASITRAEFTAIATRFFDYTAEYEGAFNDVTYSDWYAECVQAAVDMGLVNGYADGGFHPNAYITRAESCAIVNRVLNRVPHEDYLLDEDEMITWPDNSYGAWYYADMQEATNSHDYDWISVSGEVVEEWTDKLAEPNW